MKGVWKFSRSHDQCYIDCPRKAYLTYYLNGTGVVPRGENIYQSTGSLAHAILERVMKDAFETSAVPTVERMNMFCSEEVNAAKAKVLEAGYAYSGSVSAAVEVEFDRQAALAEGLARAWVKVRLPFILEEFRIVAVEEEHEIPLSPDVVLMSRLDGVLERKVDGELFAGPEFKTTGWLSEDYVESWRYSTQTISHCLDVKHVYGKEPAGVMMEFLYKGMKKKAEDGIYTYYSPLVRAFKMVDEFGGETYGFDSSLGRKRDWVVFDTYTMGMEKWMEKIPDEVLEGLLANTTVYRNKNEAEVWVRQAVMRQRRIAWAIEELNADNPSDDPVMDGTFPARLDTFCRSNQYRQKCPYKDICYGVVDDPIGSGAYVVRVPHHPSEFDADS
ncbi:MAG: PD-(D/E)XK nuclease family protein [Thermodesulfovibrionales bacterium]|jgi:hypothetical protein